MQLVLGCKVLTLTLSPNVGGCEAFERSFDFSKLQNLEEVDFRVGWTGGSLLWIPMALSTLRPATSPRLSTIRLDFSHPSTATRSVESAIEITGNNLRQVADEIEREFEGAVNLTVLWDPVFEAVSESLNVRFQFCGVDDTL